MAPSLLRPTAALLVLVLAAGCGLLGLRRDVSPERARAMLDEAVDRVRAQQLDQLCGLSESEASTCGSTLEVVSDLAPDDPPSIVCDVAVGDRGPLRGGRVLVVSGTDDDGQPFLSDFVVFDDGDAVGVLDPVWWAGVSLQTYSADTVTWRNDSSTSICADGLPGADG